MTPENHQLVAVTTRIRRPPIRSTSLAVGCLVAALVVVTDQVTKQFALALLDTSSRISLVGELLGLQLAFNTGAAFSIGSDFTPIITALGFLGVVLLITAAARVSHLGKAVSIGLILGGALGNLADRVIAPPGIGRGAVTDFIAYGQLFIGNMADIAIGAGVLLYVIIGWRLHSAANRRSAAPQHIPENSISD